MNKIEENDEESGENSTLTTADADDLLSKYGQAMNNSIRSTIGTEFELKSAQDVQELLSSLNSNQFWDDVLHQSKVFHCYIVR